MPWANGRFSRNQNWTNDAAAGVKILASSHDNEDDNFQLGIDSCLHKGGGNSATSAISMGGFRITNVGNPTSDQDAATRKWVEDLQGWPVAKYIGGTDLNGRLNFTGASGNNGLTFTTNNMSLLAKPAKDFQTSHRIVINDSLGDPTDGGSDVFIVDEKGQVNFPTWSNNLSWSSNDSKWRTIAPGTGSYLFQGGGTLHFAANRTATASDPYVATTMTTVMTLDKSGIMNLNGEKYATLVLNKGSKAADASSRIHASAQGVLRWIIDAGDATAEGGGNTGSNFAIYRYDDGGGFLGAGLTINRATGATVHYGDTTVAGTIWASQNFQSSTLNCVLAASGGGIFFRPHGVGNASYEAWFDSSGNLMTNGHLQLYGGQAGFYSGGSGRVLQFAPQWYFDWNSSTGGLNWMRGAAGWGVQMPPNGDLLIAGNVAAKIAAGQWVSWSDAQLKVIGDEYKAGLAEIMRVVPRWYKLNHDPEGRDFVGPIGQEMEDILPETCVHLPDQTVGDETFADLIQFDPTNVQWALVNAVKELHAIIDAQHERITELTARVAALEAK